MRFNRKCKYKNCNNTFRTNNPRKVFCFIDCRWKHNRKKTKPADKKPCSICGDMYRARYRETTCSDTCRDIHIETVIKPKRRKADRQRYRAQIETTTCCKCGYRGELKCAVDRICYKCG